MLSILQDKDTKINRILGLCARVEGHSILYQNLEKDAHSFSCWSDLIRSAEYHGLGPLVYAHLNKLDNAIPTQFMRILRGLYLRHRVSNTILNKSLVELLAGFRRQGIDSIVLKGAALANTVYPEQALRPMRDMDILVRERDTTLAQSILLELGYSVDLAVKAGLPNDHHHLPSLVKLVEGLSISVEIHHDLFIPTNYCRSVRFEEVADSKFGFKIGDCTAYTLGHEDMLWHVYRHAVGPHLLSTPLRLISIADLVSLVEKFLDDIDWVKLHSLHPQLLNVLPMLHWVTPWSERVLEKLYLDPRRPVDFVWEDYQGWPRTSLPTRKFRSFFRETLYPSEWWVRFCYGIGGKWAWIWYHYVRHPLHVLDGMMHQVMIELRRRQTKDKGI